MYKFREGIKAEAGIANDDFKQHEYYPDEQTVNIVLAAASRLGVGAGVCVVCMRAMLVLASALAWGERVRSSLRKVCLGVLILQPTPTTVSVHPWNGRILATLCQLEDFDHAFQ